MIEPIQFEWQLRSKAPLDQVWAAFSDTERINRIAGLHMQFAFVPRDDGKSQPTGALRHLGMRVTWTEKPVVFTALKHYLIERIYDAGPISRSQNELTLSALPDGGTAIAYQMRLTPKSRLFWLAVKLDAEMTVRPQLDKAFAATLAALDHNAQMPEAKVVALTAAAEQLLQAGLAQVQPPDVAQRLGQFLRTAPMAEQARIKPLLLAKRWQLPQKAVVAGLLQAARAGLLVPRWDVICPSCRMPAATTPTLDLQRGKSHCGACEVRYDASIADAVALTLRPAPQLRSQPERIDCLSSPSRMPHIVAQLVIPPHQEVAWTLDLLSGSYHLRGWPNLDQIALQVRGDVTRRESTVLAGPKALTPPTLRLGAGRVTLLVRSKLDEELRLVCERAWVEPHTLTVGRILEWPDVAALLPTDALEPGLKIAPYTGPAIAIQVSRGGEAALEAVGEVVRAAGARALQVSTGWVLATLPDWRAVRQVATHLQGALWQTAAVGLGTVVELTSGATCMASGALLQDLVALAQDTEAGQWRLHDSDRLAEAVRRVGMATPEVSGSPHRALELEDRQGKPMAMPTRNVTAVASGDLIDGRFELGEALGQGGFGVVFAAHDKVAGTEVVVKLLRPELAEDGVQVQRFFDEGRLASRLKGVNTARVHEWGMADDGRLFLAMERLIGRELTAVLQETGSIDPVRALKLCQGALAGLAEAHQQGLVHRDIKPANLFVVCEGTADETLKVIDFGIAVDLTGKVKPAEQAGAISGTPVYMSPEQVRGLPIDGRTDLYALAIVLYECLSGALPFTGNTSMALLLARLTSGPTPLVRSCKQPLPQGVPELVDTTLSSNAADRPPDAKTMQDAIGQIVAQSGDPLRWTRSWRAHKSEAVRLHDAVTAATDVDYVRDRTPVGPASGTKG